MSTQRVNDDSFVNKMHVIRHEDRGESSQDGSSGARMDGGPHPVAMAGPVGGFFTFKPLGYPSMICRAHAGSFLIRSSLACRRFFSTASTCLALLRLSLWQAMQRRLPLAPVRHSLCPYLQVILGVHFLSRPLALASAMLSAGVPRNRCWTLTQAGVSQ
jgi:hypothetical protein